MGYAQAHLVIQRLARAEPEAIIANFKDADPPGLDLLRSMLKLVAKQSPGAKQIDPDALDELCEILGRLMLSYFLVPDITSGRFADAEKRRAYVRRIVDGMLWQTQES